MTGALAAIACAPSLISQAHARELGSVFDGDYPFLLGVASGDPLPDGFVIWTRIFPGGTAHAVEDKSVRVSWEVATDASFRTIVAKGTQFAARSLAHSVHVEVSGLRAGAQYYYRFLFRDAESPVGAARTAPPFGSRLDRLRFALCSCQSYGDGYFGAYADVAAQRPDFVLHVGDYIYEEPWASPTRRVPVSAPHTLDDYRALHFAAKLDPSLQRAHAAAPWLVIWDDHEVWDDYKPGQPLAGFSAEQIEQKRRAASQAFYEHMPLRKRAIFNRSPMALYQRSVFGDLVQLDQLDTRQFRSPHPCPEPDGQFPTWVSCPSDDPARTLLGAQQERWLERGFGIAGARWNLIAQTTQLNTYYGQHEGVASYHSDRWGAYPQARSRLCDLVASRPDSHTVFLGGDIHAFFASEVRGEGQGAALASEVVCAAISSGGGGDGRHESETIFYNGLGQPFYFENRANGYLLCDVTRNSFSAQARKVDSVLVPDAKTSALRDINIPYGSYGIEQG